MVDLTERSRKSEDDYFRRREQELVEKLRKKAEAEAHRKGLAEAIGLDNEQILDVLREMGFDRATVVVLFLVPLLQVAWSDGSISDRERALLLEAAHAHGVSEGTPAHEKLNEWLAAKPPEQTFERALQVIRDLMVYESTDARQETTDRLMEACEWIAAASGGFLGLGSKISAEEAAVMKRVASEIERAHAAAAKRVLGAMKV
jgi:DnaJ-domain-containing protein 1